MKNLFVKNFPLILTFVLSIAMVRSVEAQTGKAAPIPAEINKIFTTSCTPCHFEGGKFMALSMVNFSNWTKYSDTKSGKKAGMICYALNKGKMPPGKVRKEIPEIVPSKEQIDLICKWAESLKEKK